VQIARISFAGHRLIVIDSPIPHEFDFSPSVSLFVEFQDEENLDAAFERLAEDGKVLMPLDDYGFSKRFGWLKDRYGVSWQLNLQA
jgi:predicted 3-demethylubiquinone-9 3-methyltransferase (glyoxalase superfamily)